MTDHPTATLADWRIHPHSTWGFRNVDRLIRTETIAAARPASPFAEGEALDLAAVDLDVEGRPSVEAALARSHTDGFLVLHRGRVVAERYAGGNGPQTRHIAFSVSKSITSILAGTLVADGLLDPEAPVIDILPETAGSAYADCSVRHLLDMTVAVRFVEDYLDPLGDVARYRVAMEWNPPGTFAFEGGLHAFLTSLPRDAGPHGEVFHYVSPNSDLLGWVLERCGGGPVSAQLCERLWRPMGAETDAFVTVDRHGAARTAGGICTTLRDLARFAEMLRLGEAADGGRPVPTAWLDDIRAGGSAEAWRRGDMVALFPEGRYRSKWYVPEGGDGPIAAIGIHGQWIWIDRSAEMVAVKFSSQPLAVDDDLDGLTTAMFRAVARYLRS